MLFKISKITKINLYIQHYNQKYIFLYHLLIHKHHKNTLKKRSNNKYVWLKIVRVKVTIQDLEEARRKGRILVQFGPLQNVDIATLHGSPITVSPGRGAWIWTWRHAFLSIDDVTRMPSTQNEIKFKWLIEKQVSRFSTYFSSFKKLDFFFFTNIFQNSNKIFYKRMSKIEVDLKTVF